MIQSLPFAQYLISPMSNKSSDCLNYFLVLFLLYYLGRLCFLCGLSNNFGLNVVRFIGRIQLFAPTKFIVNNRKLKGGVKWARSYWPSILFKV